MDKLTTVTHEYMMGLWITRIKECRASGMTVTTWCEQNNVRIKSYYYWMRKIKREAFEELSLVETSNLPVFSKINLETNETKSRSVVTVHVNDFTINIQNGASETTILNTLRAIHNLC